MPKPKPEIRIVSDGSPWGTEIYVNDKLLTCVSSVTWSAAYNEPTTATLVVNGVALEATGELDHVDIEELSK